MCDMTQADIDALVAIVPSDVVNALKQGAIIPAGGKKVLKFVVPDALLSADLFDTVRKTDYVLSCTDQVAGGRASYLGRKVAVSTENGRCYHATTKERGEQILQNGLKIGRMVGQRSTDGDPEYPDSPHYIHASRTIKQAILWYYGQLCHAGDGMVLEIDLAAANTRLIEDPRSYDCIVEGTDIPKEAIRLAKNLPSVEAMQNIMKEQGWTVTYESACTGKLEVAKGARTRAYQGEGIRDKFAHAWWLFFDECREENQKPSAQ